MTISRAKLEQIQADEETLNRFIEMLEHGYSWLSAKCMHALGGVTGEEEPEEDDEEKPDVEFDLPDEDMRRALIQIKAQDITAFDAPRFDQDDNEYFEEEVVVDPDNPNEPEKRREKVDIAIKSLYKMIKQLTHPDKLLKYSADDKVKLIAIFHESTEFMEDDNIEAMVFCYVKIRLIQNEPHKIPGYIEDYVRDRHKQILRHMANLMAKPFTQAILEWRDGNYNVAIVLFKHYLKEKARLDELERQRTESDDEFFS
jgi:hypothetical protein|uniref:Uncharacterized protein n=1 Tax=Myoviridae sp. ctshb19 TaxID=2825194 RepID=A0A8S5UH29_9CAUD|nr:MAG TPA: hypothetical protein [Myoviridae sp. ctshb19]